MSYSIINLQTTTPMLIQRSFTCYAPLYKAADLDLLTVKTVPTAPLYDRDDWVRHLSVGGL